MTRSHNRDSSGLPALAMRYAVSKVVGLFGISGTETAWPERLDRSLARHSDVAIWRDNSVDSRRAPEPPGSYRFLAIRIRRRTTFHATQPCVCRIGPAGRYMVYRSSLRGDRLVGLSRLPSWLRAGRAEAILPCAA
jgi:hypothetical protein